MDGISLIRKAQALQLLECRFLLATNMNINNKTIPIDDLSLAVYLSLHFSIEEMDRSNPRHVIFHFRNNSQVDQLIRLYWQDKASVEPKRYFQQLKLIKTRIYGNY